MDLKSIALTRSNGDGTEFRRWNRKDSASASLVMSLEKFRIVDCSSLVRAILESFSSVSGLRPLPWVRESMIS